MATWKAYEDMLKFDAGYMLTPGAHNALQGAGTLLGVDYFINSFHTRTCSMLAVAPVGRDAGFEVRGLLLDNHIEYRAGLFQGSAQAGSTAAVPPRYDWRGRLAKHVPLRGPHSRSTSWTLRPASFTPVRTWARRRSLSVGGALDMQSDYQHWAVDGFLDMPVGPGTLTAQVNFSKWNWRNFLR